MRRSAFAVLAVVAGAGCAPLPWAPEPHGCAGIPLSDVTMVSPRVGWALRLNRFDGLRAVLRTVDGGRRWTPVTPGPIARASGASLSATAASRAWLAVDRMRGSRIAVSVWATADGGRRWNRGARVRAGWGGSLQFLDGSHGWLTLNDGAAAGSSAMRVLKTNDGGRR